MLCVLQSFHSLLISYLPTCLITMNIERCKQNTCKQLCRLSKVTEGVHKDHGIQHITGPATWGNISCRIACIRYFKKYLDICPSFHKSLAPLAEHLLAPHQHRPLCLLLGASCLAAAEHVEASIWSHLVLCQYADRGCLEQA